MRFLQGNTVNLPQRPILITFDDGRLDSYRGADRILAEYGFKATMFVIAGFVEESNSFYLSWDELRRMAASRRWDLQEHAGVGHVNVRYDAAGHEGPAYAFRQYQPGRGLESFEEYKRRVEQDILWAKRTMSEQLSGFSPLTFAVPFGSYGQDRTNDARIPRLHVAAPAPPLQGRVHDRPARVHEAVQLALRAGTHRAQRGHPDGHSLPLAARPDPVAAGCFRWAGRPAGGRALGPERAP